ncbi:hypothetical protein CLCR_00988 [Cladophialophora carrionii]|uniref:Uncharacterized protein n=1 Tax=Cladophialophora carrionii TaxID=86049 RepID=A0A1C1D1E1_9EURO|nr:hypothetical protein CLCR_00988 [Cladophialophora carrionii]
MTTGFDEIRHHLGFTPPMQVFTHAGMITIGFNSHRSQHSGAPIITRIVWARDFMTHYLLSLHLTMAITLPEHIMKTTTTWILSVYHLAYLLPRASVLQAHTPFNADVHTSNPLPHASCLGLACQPTHAAHDGPR